MAKATYASLKLKTKNELKTFKFQDSEVEILSYLPIEDKVDLIDITLQKSKRNDMYSPILLDMYFHLHLVYLYTNLGFTEKQKENETKLYDTLKSNGFIDEMLKAIDENEYNELLRFLEEQIKTDEKMNISIVGFLNKFTTDLKNNAQAANNIVENFNPEKFQAVVDFATAANGGKPIIGTK